MHDLLLLKITLWIFVTLATLAVVVVGLLTSNQLTSTRYSMEWDHLTVCQLGHLLILGTAVLSLVLLGHPLTALVAWRLLSIASVMVAAIVLVKGGDWDSEHAGVLIGGIVSLVLAVFSLMVNHTQLASPSAGHPDAQSSSFAFTLPSFYTWRTTGLLALALLIAICAFSFIASARRHGLMFESSSGGLGGGSTSWQVSPSLAYLIALVLFCTLFVALLSKGPEGSPSPGNTKPETKAAK